MMKSLLKKLSTLTCLNDDVSKEFNSDQVKWMIIWEGSEALFEVLRLALCYNKEDGLLITVFNYIILMQ